nr:immunoglobulin heavy chain junction region [Mus musculus]MBK4196136.1 immunoglobulin heavy chain junction region [Mus musculus]MBK4196137.1 immunoglobulin heavy chain junction region [Mus musculus]MBK4196138.1 immunoglobulin heavy chain junction region [Mus musculus]MBK4196147.1 immunoglobulin heavy chain junction region [Mus musculus]
CARRAPLWDGGYYFDYW